jgi:hypothetical protein
MDGNKDGSRELERDDLDVGRDELGNTAKLVDAVDKDVLENLMATTE